MENSAAMHKIRCFHIRLPILNKSIASRFLVMQQAYKLGVRGYVRKQDPDTFFIMAEGDENALQKFIQWCQTFQLRKIDSMEIEEKEVKQYTSFDIIKGQEDDQKTPT